MSALFVCVTAMLLVPASAAALDGADHPSASPFLSGTDSTQPVITVGTIAEDPPDNDDDGDEDDVLGSAAVLTIDPSPCPTTCQEYVAAPEAGFVRILPSRCQSLRAPPQ